MGFPGLGRAASELRPRLAALRSSRAGFGGSVVFRSWRHLGGACGKPQERDRGFRPVHKEMDGSSGHLVGWLS